MGYVTSIKTAIFIFPIVALLFTIPFMLIQYHKYGSIHKLRVLIVYSFILYMMVIYFLVILPLPKRSAITTHFGDKMQLQPFNFVTEFLKGSSFKINDIHTYLKALKEPYFYTVIFNIFITIPFGMYLRYYYKCSFEKVVVLSFLLSLFFELTQLTGLYFIYPGPYRLFDVDDLILNTTGGCLGYALMGLFRNILPTRDKIDEDSLLEGERVSGLRRVTLFGLDSFLYLLLSIFLSLFFKFPHLMWIVFLVYFCLIPGISKGKTLGGAFLKVRLEFPNISAIRILFFNIFKYFYYLGIPILMVIGSYNFVHYFKLGPRLSILTYLGFLGLIFLYYLINFLIIVIKGSMFYDYLFKASIRSTINEVD